MLTFQTQQEALDSDQVALLVLINGTFDRVSVRHCEKQFEDYLNIGYKFIILDCTGIKFINSSGLQLMLKLVETYKEQEGMLLFIHVLPQISKFFDMLGFTPILTSFTGKEEALQYLKEQIKKNFEKKAETSTLPKLATSPATKKFQAAPGNLAQPAIASPAIPVSPIQSLAQKPYSSTRKINVQNPYDSIKPAGSSLPIANLASPNTAPPTKKMPVMIPTNLEIEISLEYYKKMIPWQVFPVTIAFTEIKIIRSKDQILHIMPYFPGCLLVPAYRSMVIKEGNQCTFWVTPQTSQKISPWIEIGRPQDNAQVLVLEVSMGRQYLAKTFFSLALLVLAFQHLTPWLTHPEALNFLVPMLPSLSFIMPYIGYAMAGILFLVSILLYWLNKPTKAKIIRKTLQMEGMETGMVSVTGKE